MKKKDLILYAKEFFDDCFDIMQRKNADYTGDTKSAFSNFESVEILGIKTEHGFLTRMMDKIKRISAFVENGELLVKDEGVEDTLKDLANYSMLFSGWIKSQKDEK